MNIPVALVIACALLVSASTAMAQTSGDVSLPRYEPTPNSGGVFTVGDSDIAPHLEMNAELQGRYEDDLLRMEGPNGETVRIDDRLTLDALFSVGVADHVEVGVGLPIRIDQSARLPNGDNEDGDIGDLRVRPKVALIDRDEYPIGLAAYAQAGIPTGEAGDFTGTNQYYIEPGLIFDVERSRWMVSANAGARLQQAQTVNGVETGPSITYGLGTEYEVVPQTLALSAEMFGSTDMNDPWESQMTSPLEGMAGVKFRESYTGLQFEVAGGGGIIEGFGTPDYRVMTGVSFATGRRDQDNDGLVSRVDKCPSSAEDLDGFDDNDGCPDLDNDADGIADASDFCPDRAEDNDGFSDIDGCPDIDNDLDGLADAADGCPNVAGDNGEGCPIVADGGREIVVNNDVKYYTEDEARAAGVITDQMKDGQALTVNANELMLLKQVKFQPGTAIITSDSQPLLDAMGQALIDHPEIELVQVQVFAGELGSEDYDLELGRERATAVRTYLVNKGVSPDRLVAVSFGKSLDEMDETNEQMEASRRVRFFILERADEPDRLSVNVPKQQ